MKQHIYLLSTLLLSTALLLSCSSGSNISRKQLESFWSQFKTAVETRDTATLLSLCEFPMGNTLEPGGEEAISRSEFLQHYYPTFFLNEEWRQKLLAATVDDLAPEGEGRILFLVTQNRAKEEVYESGLLFFFRRLENGGYKLSAMSYTE